MSVEPGSLIPETDAATEIRRLRGCMNDLISLLAIPAAGIGRDPAEVLTTLLDVLVATLRLDFAFGRIADEPGRSAIERFCIPAHGNVTLQPIDLRRALAPSFAGPTSQPRLVIPDPIGGGELAVISLRLGLLGDACVLFVGSRRGDFPTETERLLLRVAANHATIALQESRRWREQRRLARERALEERYEAMLDERTRLAREMHDTLLQGFTGVALQLVAVAGRMNDAPGTQAAVREVIALAQRTLADARRAVWGLRAPGLPGADLATSLGSAVDEALKDTGIDYRYEVDGREVALADDTELGLVRVTQEALTNIVRHAQASRVRIELAFRTDAVRLAIRDNGVGFVVDPDFRTYGGHWGLLGMHERAIEMRGTLAVHSAPGAGTEIMLRVPATLSGNGRQRQDRVI